MGLHNSAETMEVIHSTDQEKPTILIVDDDEQNLQSFKSAFRRKANILTSVNAHDALKMLDTNDVHILITDQRMPGIKGNELIAVVKERYPNIRRLIVTAYADVEAIVNAVNEGGLMGYIAKPWNEDHVWSMIMIAFRSYTKERAVKEYISQLEETNSKLEFALRQSLLS